MIENFEHCACDRCGATAAIKSEERSKTWRVLGLLVPSRGYYNSTYSNTGKCTADLCPQCCAEFTAWWKAGEDVAPSSKRLKLIPPNKPAAE